jgi:IS4 transposase
VDFLSAAEITDLYKSRWEIETFFKFIKQELNFKHLLSRNENGIKAVMYLTMITAILLTIYKKVNNIVGWAITKFKFMEDLQRVIMYQWARQVLQALNEGKNLTQIQYLSG